jgi:hypothetical protein
MLEELKTVTFEEDSRFNFGTKTVYKRIYLKDQIPFSYVFSLRFDICKTCGGYPYPSSSAKRIFCTCNDYWYKRCRDIQRSKMMKVLNELIKERKAISPINKNVFDFTCPLLLPSGYGHPPGVETCIPDSRRCGYCWRYWCGICGTGIGGMMGNCHYDKCREGRRNNLRR